MNLVIEEDTYLNYILISRENFHLGGILREAKRVI